ncbi:hypothetical protein UFOVP129_41 [uncultured Caudovirales phage]|uniref:Uncharacterized protein n=1 Tax=uncultured Caudovirales phage TaxID=2100421 RepID=A0A6J5L8G2_9CAUD|nr:hypothetical protein UFOVP129_41 [uncultured Caudovirales phage]
MSGIRQPLQDILSKLSAMSVVNLDNKTVQLHARIWNSQLDFMEDGSGYLFPRPAAFVEVLPTKYVTMSLDGVRWAEEVVFRVHLIHDIYNLEGFYDEDLTIFDLRDRVLAHYKNPSNPGLSIYSPTDCGPLSCVYEQQDFRHTNVYHYIMDFSCNFTDSKGCSFDEGAGQYFDTANPNMELQTDAEIGKGAAYIPSDDYFIIPQ